MDTTRRQFLIATAVGAATLASPFARAAQIPVATPVRCPCGIGFDTDGDGDCAFCAHNPKVERYEYAQGTGVTGLDYDDDTATLTFTLSQGRTLLPEPRWDPIPWEAVSRWDILRVREPGVAVNGMDLAIFMAGGRATKHHGIWGVKANPLRGINIFYKKPGDPEGQMRCQTVTMTQAVCPEFARRLGQKPFTEIHSGLLTTDWPYTWPKGLTKKND